ncbi:hypothetical protein B9T62_21940 [Paenibacillus donghaensis]|uniref:Uncharacterized protein n=1 Tax=Paenibacillus donghaensis TaxID=414771 RepID=A0A2Z2KJ06_9BACL|nr:hypothetical protein B9T62_21940 [Paenibacillus donghaensis]
MQFAGGDETKQLLHPILRTLHKVRLPIQAVLQNTLGLQVESELGEAGAQGERQQGEIGE